MSEMEKILQILILRINDFSIGMNIHQVEKIIAAQSIVELTQKPEYIHGLIDFYGELVAVVDLRKRLNIAQKEIELSDKFVVIETGKRKVALVVDDLAEIESVETTEITNTDAIFPGIKFVSVAKVNGKILFIYDAEALLTEKEIVEIDTLIKNFELHVAV